MKQPASIFVSHGAPTLPLETDNPARAFLRDLGSNLRHDARPDAILVVSAHWESSVPSVTLAQKPETIHDFYGFAEELYELKYPASGAPELAERTRKLLASNGIQARTDAGRGLDHGAWVPLMEMFPGAEIPVTQLSVAPEQGAEFHYAMGEALQPLKEEGILVLASGGAVHNLMQYRRDPVNVAEWARSFDDFLAERVSAGDVDGLLNYSARSDHDQAHPTDEHFLPFFVALGAARDKQGDVLHRSFSHGSLSMASYAWT
ncbi:DODA-type extradiol aromatic ring-opening family dioxygenase [Fodinicurvata fenggangensis]|uniref:DODA-type extradiol aromatic ring-opening family dioxygenase n=1 Tax=Fodinicurvata fenggangensis TaxID=1121830 RepID=UPI00047EC268|nr:class III extradiol ring-cleavage dioxygenase [Fodinicurvata fenggangensis]